MRTLPIAACLATAFLAAASLQAENYQLDPAHTSVVFNTSHFGASHVWGRFNKVEGTFTQGDELAFDITIDAASVDTGVEKRDDHLRSADFLNAREFPTITFKSTSVSQTEAGYDVTGDLTLHGVTKSITVPVVKVGEADSPDGKHRAGYDTHFTVKRSDYGMTNLIGPAGDEIELYVSVEGIRQ